MAPMIADIAVEYELRKLVALMNKLEEQKIPAGEQLVSIRAWIADTIGAAKSGYR